MKCRFCLTFYNKNVKKIIDGHVYYIYISEGSLSNLFSFTLATSGSGFEGGLDGL